VESFARVFLLAITAALFVVYLQHGPAGVRNWLRAKFLGSPSASSLTPTGG
jgi:hypothetical protein